MVETFNLSGTWTISSPTNGPGTFTFNTNNSGTYKFEGEQGKKDFYWWTSNNSFWMQISNGANGWMEIIEGKLSSNTAGSGNIIAAEQGESMIAIAAFTMSKD